MTKSNTAKSETPVKAKWAPSKVQIAAATKIITEQANLDKSIAGLEKNFQKHAQDFLAMFETPKQARQAYIQCLPRDMELATAAKKWQRFNNLALTGTTQSASDIAAKAKAKEAANLAAVAFKEEDAKPANVKQAEKVIAKVLAEMPETIVSSPKTLGAAIRATEAGNEPKVYMGYDEALEKATKNANHAVLSLIKTGRAIEQDNPSFVQLAAWVTFAHSLANGKNQELVARDLSDELMKLNLKFSK